MLKILLLSVFVFSPSLAYANEQPNKEIDTDVIIEMTHSYNRKPDNALYLSSQEQKNIFNEMKDKIYIVKNKINNFTYNTPNYSIDLGKNKKEKILQSVKDAIDDGKNFYQAFHIKYTLKYSEQCPVGYKNKGDMDIHICHDTYEQYLHKKEQYKIYADFYNERLNHKNELDTKKDLENSHNTNSMIDLKLKYLPTFWHDTEYYVPDSKYITNRFNDIILDNNNLFINFNKICIKDNDIVSFFKINPQDVMDEDSQYHFHIDYHNEIIIFNKNYNGCIKTIELGGEDE